MLPRRHLGSFTDLTPAERSGLAEILKAVTTRYDNLFQVSFPYTMGFHQRPAHGRARSDALPRALLSAAAALGGDTQIHGRVRDAGHAAARPDAGDRRRAAAGAAGEALRRMTKPAELTALHLASYSVPPRLFSAPGRVNLIGEHTDYCDGFVLPAAIDFSTLVAISPRADGRVVAHSVNFDERVDKPIAELLDDGFASLRAGRKLHWSDYPAGVLWALREHGVPVANGFSFTLSGDVPLGAGLSSSASVEVATAFAVLGTSRISLFRLPRIAQLCRRAENAFVGANVGIMDQFVSCCGAQDHAVMIDCRSLEYTLAPIPPDVRIVICNSMVKHSNAGGEYNTRRAEIEEGTAILRAHRTEIKALRDATVDDLAHWGNEMKPERAAPLPPHRHGRRSCTGRGCCLSKLEPDPLRRVDGRGARQLPRRLRGFVPGDRCPRRAGCTAARLLWRAHYRGRLRRLHGEPCSRGPDDGIC